MKNRLLFLLLLVLALPAQATSPLDVRTCLNLLPSIQDFERAKEHAEICYRKAKIFSESESVSDRAIYLEALVSVVGFRHFSRELSAYQIMADETLGYYKSHLYPLLESSRLPTFSDQVLIDALEAINSGLFYPSLVNPEPPGVSKISEILSILEARNAAQEEHAFRSVRTFLSLSDWKTAKEIVQRWPQIGPLPDVDLGTTLLPTELGYLSLSSDKRTLVLQKYVVSKGPQILIFGDCHFAIDAYQELSSRPAFVKAMREYGLVLGSPVNFNVAEIDSLRTQFPAFEIHPVYKQGAWSQKGFNTLISPNFAFFLDGKAVHTFSSFIPELQNEFCRGLEKIGLIDPKECGENPAK